MTPPVESWPARELEERVLGDAKGKRRKGFDGDFGKCQLVELLQYSCEVEKPVTRESKTRCWPVERLFRKCLDRDGSFIVETTIWERGEKKIR